MKLSNYSNRCNRRKWKWGQIHLALGKHPAQWEEAEVRELASDRALPTMEIRGNGQYWSVGGVANVETGYQREAGG